MKDFIATLETAIRIEEAKLNKRLAQLADPTAHLGETLQESRTPDFIRQMKRGVLILKCANSALTQMDKPFDDHHIDYSICVEEIKSHKHMQLHVTVTSDKHEIFGVWKEPG